MKKKFIIIINNNNKISVPEDESSLGGRIHDPNVCAGGVGREGPED